MARGFSFASSLQDGTEVQFKELYIRRLDVLNRGFSGYNTTQALEILPQIIPLPSCAKIEYMTIFFGANDACLPTSGTGQHVSLEKFRENLLEIINHPSVKNHKPKMILITPPPIDEYMRSANQELNAKSNIDRTASQTAQYADVVREVGKHLGIAVLDIWTIFIQMAGWRPGDRHLPGSKEMNRALIFGELLYDGLHLNYLGYRILFTSLMDLIRGIWPKENETTHPLALPAWNDEKAWAKLHQT